MIASPLCDLSDMIEQGCDYWPITWYMFPDSSYNAILTHYEL